MGDRVERPGAADPARLHRPSRGLLPGDRPGGDVRRGAVRRVRPALPAAARLPLRGRRRRRAVGVPDGEVAHRGHRGWHPRPRRHHATGCRRRSSRSARVSSSTRPTASSATTSTRTGTSGRCSGWCTGCCSGSWRRNATCCTRRTSRRRPGERYARYFSARRLRQASLRRAGAVARRPLAGHPAGAERPRRGGGPAAPRPARPRRHLRQDADRFDARRAAAVQRVPAGGGQVPVPRLGQVDQAVPPRRLPAPGLRRTRLPSTSPCWS